MNIVTAASFIFDSLTKGFGQDKDIRVPANLVPAFLEELTNNGDDINREVLNQFRAHLKWDYRIAVAEDAVKIDLEFWSDKGVMFVKPVFTFLELTPETRATLDPDLFKTEPYMDPQHQYDGAKMPYTQTYNFGVFKSYFPVLHFLDRHPSKSNNTKAKFDSELLALILSKLFKDGAPSCHTYSIKNNECNSVMNIMVTETEETFQARVVRMESAKRKAAELIESCPVFKKKKTEPEAVKTEPEAVKLEIVID